MHKQTKEGEKCPTNNKNNRRSKKRKQTTVVDEMAAEASWYVFPWRRKPNEITAGEEEDAAGSAAGAAPLLLGDEPTISIYFSLTCFQSAITDSCWSNTQL